MTPRARRKVTRVFETVLVSGGIALVALVLARMDRRIDRAEAQVIRDTVQDGRLNNQDRQFAAIREYMLWSTRMMIRVAGRLGVIIEAPPMPISEKKPTGPSAPRGAGGR